MNSVHLHFKVTAGLGGYERASSPWVPLGVRWTHREDRPKGEGGVAPRRGPALEGKGLVDGDLTLLEKRQSPISAVE